MSLLPLLVRQRRRQRETKVRHRVHTVLLGNRSVGQSWFNDQHLANQLMQTMRLPSGLIHHAAEGICGCIKAAAPTAT